MHSDVLFSVIVPFYNSSRTLSRCIQSILEQSFLDFELILIDDGSTDGSSSLAYSAAQSDSRVLFVRQENCGVSSARNIGIAKSSGKFILFVDSDDWVDNKYLFSYLNDCKDHSNFVVQGYCRDNDLNKCSLITFEEAHVDIESLLNSSLFLSLLESCAPFGKLYSNIIIKQFDLKFNVELSYGEDLLFMLNYFFHIKTVQFVSAVHYCYSTGNNASLSSQIYSFESEYALFLCVNESVDGLCHKFCISNLSQVAINNFVASYLLRAVISIYVGRNVYGLKNRLIYLSVISAHCYVFDNMKCSKNFNFVHQCASVLLKKRFFLIFDLLCYFRYAFNRFFVTYL